MAEVIFKLNSAGVVEMLQSAGAQAVVQAAGQMTANASGIDCELETLISGDRAACRVLPATKEAIAENYETNALQKALGGVRV
ncbi:MAG: hypothetical protein IKG25_05810 [Mogibacterium sp.]|nr:hypothetical protein [Mogibacterium sp.]MBR4090410.1 hypothetical protein [Mogibacterium sp.]